MLLNARVFRLEPGTTKNKLARAMGMIGEMRGTPLMQKSIRDIKFPDCRYVFFNEDGERIGDFRRAWASACKRSRVEIGKEDQKLLFHDLRRSAARNMRRAGIDRSLIKRFATRRCQVFARAVALEQTVVLMYTPLIPRAK